MFKGACAEAAKSAAEPSKQYIKGLETILGKIICRKRPYAPPNIHPIYKSGAKMPPLPPDPIVLAVAIILSMPKSNNSNSVNSFARAICIPSNPIP